MLILLTDRAETPKQQRLLGYSQNDGLCNVTVVISNKAKKKCRDGTFRKNYTLLNLTFDPRAMSADRRECSIASSGLGETPR